MRTKKNALPSRHGWKKLSLPLDKKISPMKVTKRKQEEEGKKISPPTRDEKIHPYPNFLPLGNLMVRPL